MTTQHNRIVKIFYSYAHKDKALRDELESHLESLRRSGQITTWYDREILPGMEWKRAIDVHLNTSDIILLLISPSFMRSDYCFGVEMRRALERHKAGETHIIPIILRPVVWKSTPIGELQALPTEGKPITTWRNRDSAFQDVVKGVGTVVEMICSQAEREIGQGSTFSHQEEDAKIASNLENAARTDHISNSPLQKSTPPDVYPQQQNIVSSASSSSQDRHKPISVSSRNSVHDRPRSHWKTILLTSIVIFIIFSGLGLFNLFHTNGNTTNNIRPTATSLTANSSGQTNGNQHLGLESHFTRFVLTVDVNGLLTDSQQAINAVKQQVQAQPALQNREVGLAIVYGGASNDSQISTALNVAQKVYAIFQALGHEGPVFARASDYYPLYILGSKNSIVTVNVYRFIEDTSASCTIDPHFTRFVLTVDVNGLLTDSQQAINAVKQQVQAQPALQNREVGLAIVYGGASNDSQISTALNVAQKVYAIFQALGQKEIIFTGASYYDPLFNLSSNNNMVEVDVFLCKI